MNSTTIMGESKATLVQMQRLLRYINPEAPAGIEKIFLEESAIEGVKGDIAFCQAIHETDYFRFTGTAKREWNNPCGLGVTGLEGVGARFSTWKLGVRAQIQHLKAYGSNDSLRRLCVDPRFHLVTRGIAPKWINLNGRWAVPGKTYGQSILALYARLLGLPKTHSITIDPGHGGADRANKGPTGYIEADGVLEISNYLKCFLEATGKWTANLTRGADITIDLRIRSRMAKLNNSIIFVSQHTNASGRALNSTARGTEVFYSVDIARDRTVAQKLSKAISKALGVPDRGAKTRTNPNPQPFDGKNTVEDYMAVVDEAQDIGIPHVFLVESAFHDHAEDEALLKDRRNLMKIAIAQGIEFCKMFDISLDVPNQDVLTLQKLLNNKGYGLKEDGYYGAQTGSAIMDFEHINKLPLTGLLSQGLASLLTKSKEDRLSEALAAAGWITDTNYWSSVFKGEVFANPEYLQIAFRRALESQKLE